MELETPSPARSVVEAVLLDPNERSKLIRYARVRFGIDSDTAEDLLQETALDLLRQQSLVRSPKGFVFTVFRVRCSRLLRKNVADRRVFAPAEPETPQGASGSSDSQAIDSRLALQEALEEVSAGCRKLLRAYYFEGRSLREAADVTARAYSGVWKTIDRCLKKLRQCLA
jgi:RNA polymerase sigma factor (sigma-70 family)